MSCLRTMFLSAGSDDLAAGDSVSLELKAPSSLLLLSYSAAGFHDWWDSSTVSVSAKFQSKESWMLDDQPVPGHFLSDLLGPRRLPEFQPMRANESVAVRIYNDGSDALSKVKASGEVLLVSDDDLKRYETDPTFRAELHRSLADAARR